MLRQTCQRRLSQGTVEAAAQRDGVSMITVRRAKCDLGILSAKDSVNSAWYWTCRKIPSLPNPPLT